MIPMHTRPVLAGLFRALAAALLATACTASSSSNPAPSSPTPSKPIATRPTPSRPSAARERTLTRVYVTGYSWWDNTPPGATIAYPRSNGSPTKHDTAGGVGTYDDPITVAVGWAREGGGNVTDWPVGARFYVPALERYLLVEDQCGDHAQAGPCHQLTAAPQHTSTWLDVWVGGQHLTRKQVDTCTARITGQYAVIYRPKRGYPVARGDVCR